jgi:hypothetical protein
LYNPAPIKLIPIKELNNWEQYRDGLKRFPLLETHLKNIFMKWVETLSNPLSVPWILYLYKDKLDFLDEFLQQMQNEIGEDIITGCLDELYVEGGRAHDLFKKIISIESELFTFSQLRKLGQKNLLKISKIGDIESGSDLISIKSIFDLDIQYQIIENVIWGLFYIKEHESLRKYNYVRIFGGVGLDDRFLLKIIDYIECPFMDALLFTTNQSRSIGLQVNSFQPYFDNTEQYESQFNVSISRYVQNFETIISFHLTEHRYGKEINQKHEINILISDYHRDPKNSLYIDFDTHSFFVGEEIKLNIIKDRVKSIIEKFDSSEKKVLPSKNFIGWINISISPMHENYVIGNFQKITSELSKLKENRQYKIIVCLSPQLGFELKKPKWFQL